MTEHSKTAWVLTQHQWVANREAGFHAIGRALLSDEWHVLFLTSPLTWSFVLGRVSDGGWKNARQLLSGRTHETERGKLVNLSAFDFSPPRAPWISFSEQAERRLLVAAKRRVPQPDLVVFESTRMVRQIPMLRRWFPNVPFIYRPSDPIICRTDQGYGPTLHQAELDAIRTSQRVLCVNPAAVQAYREHLEDRYHSCLECLPNGLHLEHFSQNYPKPPKFPDTQRPLIGYIGASGPNWQAIHAAAMTHPNIQFLIVCPVLPPTQWKTTLLTLPNVSYQPGIPPREVPAWLFHLDAVMVPYPDECRHWVRGGHAKLYQAIAAGKPILGLNTGQGSQSFVSIYCEATQQFVQQIPKIFDSKLKLSPQLISNLDWGHFHTRFLEVVHEYLPPQWSSNSGTSRPTTRPFATQ